MFLLDDLLMAPIKGVQFIAGKIYEVVDKELNDESVIKKQLLQLQMQLEEGEISEEEFADQEAELFARLRAIRQRELEAMQEAQQEQQFHTADSSSIVVETPAAGSDGSPAADLRS